MHSERDKMLAGEWYDANFNEELIDERYQAKAKCDKLNQTPHDQIEERQQVIDTLFNNKPENLELLSPFMVDYGNNITIGKNVSINHYCYFMDGASISIGDNVFMGPSVGLYTATHPMQVNERNKGLEKAKPITVEDNCWFGAKSSVLAGVTVGEGSVIAAGAVVTRDVPPNSVVGGVPARVMSVIDQDGFIE